MRWVPGHAGVDGNEWADEEANVARGEDQDGCKVWFEAAKRRIGRMVGWRPEQYERLSTAEQVVLAQLRTAVIVQCWLATRKG